MLLVCLAFTALAEEPATPAKAEGTGPAETDLNFRSPDGRFAFRHSAEEDDEAFAQIYDKKSGKTLVELGDQAILSRIKGLRLLWAPDSNSFAANFQAGGRYETTVLYRWNGTDFTAIEFPEAALYEKIVEPARQRELKLAKKPGDTYLRRIWDTWKTTKWIDADTFQIEGESICAYYEGEEKDEPIDLAVGVRATVKIEKDGKTSIVKAEEVPASD